mmetsp:Transcript_31160/g.69288  ORF Transcript_31160/g.69288 Transcript_31160/m.69288 type:complete len:95 (+) Transcript_31160:618-902(+)
MVGLLAGHSCHAWRPSCIEQDCCVWGTTSLDLRVLSHVCTKYLKCDAEDDGFRMTSMLWLAVGVKAVNGEQQSDFIHEVRDMRDGNRWLAQSLV